MNITESLTSPVPCRRCGTYTQSMTGHCSKHTITDNNWWEAQQELYKEFIPYPVGIAQYRRDFLYGGKGKK